MTISAQVSLYPLGTAPVGPAIESAIACFRRRDVQVWEGAMSTLLAGELDDVVGAIRDAFAAATATGEAVMVVTLANGCPLPSTAGG